MSQSSPYYFVAPSDPDGDRFAYSKTGAGHPAPVFVQAAWEWLLERVTRRLTLLRLVGAPGDAVSLNLSERRGMFRMPRLPGLSYGSGGLPAWEAPFSYEDAHSFLPGTYDGVYTYVQTAYTPAEVPGLVAELLELGGADGNPGASPACWFCDPGRWPEERSVDASYREVTEVLEPAHDTSEEPEYESGTKVVHRPYDLSGILPVFRPLGDMRVDEFDVRTVPVWDPEAGEFAERRMVCPRTRFPRSFDADPDHGELVDVEVGHDWYVPDGQREHVRVMVLHGLTRLSAGFAADCRVNADLGDYEGASGAAWARWDDVCRRDSMRGYVGALAEAPSPSRTGLGFAAVHASYRGTVHPAPDWGGKASCWEAWGIPDLGAVPAGTAYRRQLEAACSARPCIPPAAPPLPASDDADGAQFVRECPVAPPGGPRRPPCAASPVNAALVLDRLSVTVHEVGRLYARVDVERTLSASESGKGRSGRSGSAAVSGAWRRTTEAAESVSGSFVGDLRSLFGLGEGYYSLSMGDPDGSNSYVHVDESSTVDEVRSETGADYEESRGVERTSVSAKAAGLVALRGGAGVHGLATSASSREEYSVSGDYYGDAPYDESSERTYGEDSEYVPEDGDLLFHPDVMAWMKKAELFAVVRVAAVAEGGEESSSTLTGTWSGSSGMEYVSESSRSGRRTSRGRYRVVSLGEMDLSTGEFPDLDLAGFVMDSLPHGGGTGFSHPGIGPNGELPSPWTYSSETRETNTYGASSGSGVRRYSDSRPERYSPSVEMCGAYVAVEWKFDAGDPPSPSGGGGGAARAGTAARAALAAAEGAVSRASSGASALSSRLSRLSARLSSLSSALSGGTPAREAAVDAAEAALETAEAARDEAAEAAAGARDALAAAEDALDALPAGASPADRDSALSACDAARRALRAAEEALRLEEAEVDARGAELGDMRSGAEVDQAAAEAALADAEDALSAAEDALADAESLEPAARAALGAAREAVSAMWAASYDAQAFQAAVQAAKAAAGAAKDAARELSDAVGEAGDAAAAAEASYAAAFAAAWGA